MDLVCTYDSDESGDDKSKSQSKNKPVKQIDVIELTDSDSDSWSPKKSSANTSSVEKKEESVKKISETVQNEGEDKPSKDSSSMQKRVIECIELDEDSDCDESNTTQEKVIDNKPTGSNVVSKGDISQSKKVDHLNLDGSDSDESKTTQEKNTGNKITDSNEISKSDTSQSKKVDYLNLEGSDSENEQQLVHEKIDNLLNSAAILSDAPCGPEKSTLPQELLAPIPLNKTVLEANSFALPQLKTLDNTSSLENKNFKDGNITNHEKIILPETIPIKRFKRESETPKSTISGADIGENEEFATPTSFMYRKDERITGAFAKSVVCRLPRQITRNYISHINVITSLQWCIPQYSHLLLSASADCTIKVWDMCCRHAVQNIKVGLGIKAAKWSLSGEQIIAGGYGKKARVFDVLSGKEIISYDIFNHISSIEVHPYMDDVFLCGTRNAIFGFDLRVASILPVRTFLSKCEEVLDLAFLDENEFVCSTSIVSHDSADRTIMVWDFSSGAIMSNQVYLERYTCPFLKVHPQDSCFIAQTNGDYIAAFSTQKPYKIKDKRYMGHKVSGYGVECDISPDGKYIATGDAHGDLYFYNYSNTNMISRLSARSNVALNRLKWHPALNSTIASATWDGHIQIWK